jgi:hypothetical protein
MTHLNLLVFVTAVLALILLTALVAEYRLLGPPYPRREADKRAIVLLRSWFTPEQNKQWAARGQFEVIGCDTGTRYRIICRVVMNVHQLDLAGRTVARWCFAPEGGLAYGDILLAQKIALETMEQRALALANCQSCRRT